MAHIDASITRFGIGPAIGSTPSNLYITQETDAGWTCRHFVSVYRALLREELTAMLHQAGFVELRWLMPADSGFYQPLVLAHYARLPHTVPAD